MSTLDSKDLIIKLIKDNGNYEGGPQCLLIARYTTASHKEVYNVQYTIDGVLEAMSSPYVKNWRTLWQRNYGLTVAGKRFLKENE